MNIKICPLCVMVSGAWLLMQVGIFIGLLNANSWILAVSIAMGGTVVGIAYQTQSLRWKSVITVVGMPLAYFFVTHINVLTIVLEVIILFVFAYFFFLRQTPTNSDRIRDLENKMKNCC